MFESKIQLKKKIKQLEEKAFELESYISDMHFAHRKSQDIISELTGEKQELMEKNKQILQENVDLLHQLRKILKEAD